MAGTCDPVAVAAVSVDGVCVATRHGRAILHVCVRLPMVSGEHDAEPAARWRNAPPHGTARDRNYVPRLRRDSPATVSVREKNGDERRRGLPPRSRPAGTARCIRAEHLGHARAGMTAANRRLEDRYFGYSGDDRSASAVSTVIAISTLALAKSHWRSFRRLDEIAHRGIVDTDTDRGTRNVECENVISETGTLGRSPWIPDGVTA